MLKIIFHVTYYLNDPLLMNAEVDTQNQLQNLIKKFQQVQNFVKNPQNFAIFPKILAKMALNIFQAVHAELFTGEGFPLEIFKGVL
jgi:hypothetical protein